MKPSLRFEVFKRDNFTCRYCGQAPPTAILEVDHIIPSKNSAKPTCWKSLKQSTSKRPNEMGMFGLNRRGGSSVTFAGNTLKGK